MKKPSGRLPRRGCGQEQRQRYILRVLSEGEVTEPAYFTEWARRNRRNVRLKLDDTGMTPASLVRRAREYLRTRRPRREGPDFDEIWCVFDTDQHPNLAQAINEAGQSGIGVAVSNPCFELWLVLHVGEQTAFMNRHGAQHMAIERGLCEGKNIPQTAWNVLDAGFETAKERAQALAERHVGNGNSRRENPSSEVWQLVDRLRRGI